MFPFSPVLSLNEGLCGLRWHVYGWRSCRVELVREGNEGAQMRFLICLMSHNKARWSLGAPRCETAAQHSYKLRMPCQLSGIADFPSFLLSLSCQSKTSRQRKWDRKMRQLMSVGRQDAEEKKREQRMSEWQLTVCPSHASLSMTASAVSCCLTHTRRNPARARAHIGRPSTQRPARWQHSRQQLIMSVFLAALEKSLERGGDGCLDSHDANVPF